MTIDDCGDCGRDGGFCWSYLAARLIHPVQVEIIEALRWIDRPLSATDFIFVFGGKRTGLRIEHHLRRLRKLGVVVLHDAERGGIPAISRLYRLVKRPGCRPGKKKP